MSPMQPSIREVIVDGVPIRYRHYAHPGATSLLLLHGGGAHGAWWSGMVEPLSQQFDLIMPDLSGHGDSGRRERYTPQAWEDEVAAVLAQEAPQRTVVVGHSMGGMLAAHLCGHRPGIAEQVVIIDTLFCEPSADGKRDRWRGMRRGARSYPTFDDALRRFRLVPQQLVVNPELTEEIGRQSIVEVEDGWAWKADPEVYGRFDDRVTVRALQQISCPVSFIYGQHSSLCGPDTGRFLATTLGSDIPIVEIPDAQHHVVIDQPAACAAEVVRLIDEGWVASDDRSECNL